MNISYKPLKEPIPLTEQIWPEGTIPLVHTRTMTFMHENYIRDCIEGILMQKTTFPVQFLIHDDASTDKTADIVREYEQKYPKLIKAYYQTENSYSKPDKMERRSEFSSWRIGKYEALCEGDDYWTDPLKLQKQVDFMEANPDYSLCYHTHKSRTGDFISLNQNPKKGKDFTGNELVRTPNDIATATKLYVNYSNNTNIKIPSLLSGDYVLNAFLGTLGGCKFLDTIEPSIRRKHAGGVWTSRSENNKFYGLINTKIKVYEMFKELNDEPRMNLALDAIKDAIHNNLYRVNANIKKFKIDLRGIQIQYNGFEFMFFYFPFVLKLIKLMNKLFSEKK